MPESLIPVGGMKETGWSTNANLTERKELDAFYAPYNVPADEMYPNVFFTDYGSSDYNLGLNPYVLEEYDPSHNVLSPNGDGYLDQISEIYLSMMRNGLHLDR